MIKKLLSTGALVLALAQLSHADYKRPSNYDSIPIKNIPAGSGSQNQIVNAIKNAGNKGLRLRIGRGNHDLGGILIEKDNIFFEVHQRAVLRLRDKDRIMIHVGPKDTKRVLNFGIFGPSSGKKCSVQMAPNGRKGFDVLAEFIRLSNVNNFYIANINIFDPIFTRGASMWFLPRGGSANNGTIRDIFQANSHRGYGITQVYKADNCFFKNLSGVGGVQLRFETDQFGGTSALVNCDGDNIRGERGQSTVVFSPHWADSRGCNVTNIFGNSCFNSVRLARGFFTSTSKVQRRGRFSGSSVHNIRSTYGTKGTENIYKAAAELFDNSEWKKVRSRFSRNNLSPKNKLTKRDTGTDDWVITPTSTPVFSFEGDIANNKRGVKISKITRKNYPPKAFQGKILAQSASVSNGKRNQRINNLPK